MLVKGVTQSLERIATALSSSEDKTAVEAIIAVLRPHAALTVAQLDAALTTAHHSAKKAPKPVAEKKSKTPSVDLALVEKYVGVLECSSGDGAAVRGVLAELKADKRAKVGEVGGILSRVRGSEVKVARKAEGLKEIEQWFQRKRDTERRVSGAGEIY